MTDIKIRRALISAPEKGRLIGRGRCLARHGVEILSTGGSAKALADAKLSVVEVGAHTGFPEIMDGRVKTLHPKIHGGILGRRDVDAHRAAMSDHAIAPIDLVVVNLYQFEATVAKGADFENCIENIDIGGPALIRAAAKNHDFVAVVTDPADYADLMAEMDSSGGATTLALRRRLAAPAYARTGAYDTAISQWFTGQLGPEFPGPPLGGGGSAPPPPHSRRSRGESRKDRGSGFRGPPRREPGTRVAAAKETPRHAAHRRHAEPRRTGSDRALRRRRLPGAGPRQWPGQRRGPEGRDQAGAEQRRAGGPVIRLPRAQARQVQCHRLFQQAPHGSDRGR